MYSIFCKTFLKMNICKYNCLLNYRCKNSNTNWEPVVRGKPLMGSVTQSQRFSFSADILSQYLNQYIYISCHLTVCRNYQTTNNEFIPQVGSNVEWFIAKTFEKEWKIHSKLCKLHENGLIIKLSKTKHFLEVQEVFTLVLEVFNYLKNKKNKNELER